MKGNVHTVPVQSGLCEQEKQLKLLEQVKLQALSVIKKYRTHNVV